MFKTIRVRFREIPESGVIAVVFQVECLRRGECPCISKLLEDVFVGALRDLKAQERPDTLERPPDVRRRAEW